MGVLTARCKEVYLLLLDDEASRLRVLCCRVTVHVNSVKHVSEAAQAESYPGPSGRLAPKFPFASELRNDEEVIGTS